MPKEVDVYQEGDLFIAEDPELGTVSQGASIEEALANLKEATELYLEEFPSSCRSGGGSLSREAGEGRGGGSSVTEQDPLPNPPPR